MSEFTYMVGFYTSVPAASIPQRLVWGLDRAGFDVRATESAETVRQTPDDEYRFRVPFRNGSFLVYYRTNDDREPGNPAVELTAIDHYVHPYWSEDADEYHRHMNSVLELLSRLAVVLEADYVPLIDAQTHGTDATPSGEPIAETVSVPPPFGIYSPPVLDGFGGPTGLSDTEPWYTAELTDGRTVVIRTAEPWANGGWRPPTDASYIQNAQLRDERRGQEDDGDLTLSDPFAALTVGDYGVDACVAREDIAAEFRNEDLQAVRVYVDEAWNLRRVSDDSFVRNVVTDAPDDETALIEGMLAEIPPDANEDLMVSALLHGAIPTSFVRLDDPDGDNVVSRVLDLDVETNKVDLLVSLGNAAQHGDGLATRSIESALDNLADLEDVDGIERYIQQNLL